mmetsp:Transcript_3553/g.7190  ORF Transcript_3553/g.7190 Transcript_3553/m.7190 type:complete len:750 (-) Transcript_3553:153-2402(-)
MSGRSKRARRPVQKQAFAPSAQEQLLINQAIANSRIDQGRSDLDISAIVDGPVYYPTVEEFQHPLKYVNKIRAEASNYGICKIVPPQGWNMPCEVDMESKKEFETKRQIVNRLQEGVTFGDGEEYNPASYQKYASDSTKAWKDKHYKDRDMTPEALEKDYWNIVETNSEKFVAEYGNDIDCTEYWSGFPLSRRGRALNGTSEEKDKKEEPEFGTEEYYRESWWNLNNMPTMPGSVLRHVKVPINGVNVPWLYMGTLFSTFCWHNEDNYLYSINYHHKGAPKQWYGVPGTRKDADGLEKVFKNFLMLNLKDTPDLLHHITTMFSPILLRKANIPVCKIQQHPGEFIITFPRAFHGGFSMGPNIGEAVNFATPDWLAHGADASERYRTFSRQAVFSHDRLMFTMAQYLNEHSIRSCEMLGTELTRVIREEDTLRRRLYDTGIQNVSGKVPLPRNNLEKLDEASANYDDKRLCLVCKHICFFSAVACRCSSSKVACLRHANWLCSCPPRQKFLLTWESIPDMVGVQQAVSKHLKILRAQEHTNGEVALPEPPGSPHRKRSISYNDHVPMTGKLLENVQKNREARKGYTVPVCPALPLPAAYCQVIGESSTATVGGGQGILSGYDGSGNPPLSSGNPSVKLESAELKVERAEVPAAAHTTEALPSIFASANPTTTTTTTTTTATTTVGIGTTKTETTTTTTTTMEPKRDISVVPPASDSDDSGSGQNSPQGAISIDAANVVKSEEDNSGSVGV